MGDRLKGKNAIVTGSGRQSVARGIALYLASEGANVLVNDPGPTLEGSSDAGPGSAVVDEIKAAGGNAVLDQHGLTTPEDGEAIVQAALDAFGRVDILVNAAHVQRDRMVFNMPPEEWYAVVNPILKGNFCMIKPASILMRQQKYGRIVNISAVSGLEGTAAQANYGAAVAGVVGMTRVVGRDLGRYGVTCNCVALGDVQDPEYVAPLVAWLCTDKAWNVNAKTFHAAGGEISGGYIALALEEVFDRSIVKRGQWTIEELAKLVPSQLMVERANPAPPGEDIDVPGRQPATPAAPAAVS